MREMKIINVITKNIIIVTLILALGLGITGNVFADELVDEPIEDPVEEQVEPWTKNSAGIFVDDEGNEIPGATMKGIDVSHHNGSIDWAKVAATDIDYAIIRCGYGDNLTNQDDRYWEANVAGCEKYNIPYGVYIYSYATSVAQAKSEVQHVLRMIKGLTLNFPIYLDMEDPIQAKLPIATLESIASTFLKEIYAAGYECGIYANLDWWNNRIPASIANNTLWYKWIAQWGNKCTYTGSYQMWQFSGDNEDSVGYIDGINGVVDLNLWFGEVRDRSYDIKKYTPVVVTPKPVVKPVAKKVTPPKRVTIKSVKKGKKKASIKWKKVSGAKGYKIQYSTKKSFKAKYTKSKTTNKTSITIKKLKSKKVYYFRVKAYKLDSKNKKVYSNKWSKTKRTKIK